jgi:hypothetical protein
MNCVFLVFYTLCYILKVDLNYELIEIMTRKMTEMNQISSNEDLNKVAIPLRRVELALNRIIEIGIPFHLKNLEQHKHLIQTVFHFYLF